MKQLTEINNEIFVFFQGNDSQNVDDEKQDVGSNNTAEKKQDESTDEYDTTFINILQMLSVLFSEQR